MTTGISFHQDAVDVLTATTSADRYGNEALGWADPIVATVPGCRVLPENGDEKLDRNTRRLILFAPPGTAITSANRVRFNGVIYDVEDVRHWRSPTGALAHIEADLQRVEG